MIHGIWTIYRKELMDTLRDRRTLIFMLILPVLALPAMMWGVNSIVEKAVRKQQSQVVKIAADAATQEAYLLLVHDWFKNTDMATGRRAAQTLADAQAVFEKLGRVKSSFTSETPAADTRAQQDAAAAFAALEKEFPQAVLDDPLAFKTWVSAQAEKLRENIDVDKAREELKKQKISAAQIKESVEFYRVALKGLGLIEFVDPATLGQPPADFQLPKLPDDVEGMETDLLRRLTWGIRDKQIHGYLRMPDKSHLGLTPLDESGGNMQLTALMVYDSTMDLSDESYDRLSRSLREGSRALALDRLEESNLDIRYQDPVKISDQSDLATDSDIAVKVIGGILPYLVIAFAFLGGMYPAIDIGAGEKERNTLETLILAPSTRTEIALGKFLVIFTSSVTASLMGLASMAITFKMMESSTLLSNLQFQIGPGVAISVALLVIPPAAMFAGLFLAISIYARSFKEAQSYMAPLQFVLILPALAPALPGFELSWRTAFIPLVNVSMLTRDFLKGDIHWGYYGVTISTCLIAAMLCVLFAVYQFRKEEVLFRT